jgi:hypothetical protein
VQSPPYIASCFGGGAQLRTFADKRINAQRFPTLLSTVEASPSTLGALSSEKTGFPFERKHWCRWLTRRWERA